MQMTAGGNQSATLTIHRQYNIRRKLFFYGGHL
jgi:hypothetical protein